MSNLAINSKFYCALCNKLLSNGGINSRQSAWLLLILLLFILMGCGEATRQRNVPVVRLPSSIVYSQDPKFYIVRPGDTLYSIAWLHGLDYRALAKKNQIGTGYMINIGQKLQVKFDADDIADEVIVKKIAKPASIPSIATANKKKPPKKIIKSVKLPPQKPKSKKAKKPSKLTITPKKRIKKWRWPVDGKLVAQFSSSRGGNKGIDIATDNSQPVRAIADGVVVYSGEGLRGYGKLVIIKHNDDYLSAYAYNSKIRVKEKIAVKVGDIIADTGINGLYKNRLHLEVRYKGKPVNPLKYLKR